MRVTAYSIQNSEKEFLTSSNHQKHDITFISKPLNTETVEFAEGKDAVIVFISDNLSAQIIHRLADLGIKYIATRSIGTSHIDKSAAAERGIKLANVPAEKLLSHPDVMLTPHLSFLNTGTVQQICDQTIKNLDLWQLGKCIGKACVCARNCAK